MAQYLIFIKRENEGIFRLYFSSDVETAWGDNWNVTPAGIIYDIQPEINCVSSCYRIETDLPLILASENTCFSMQDSIDGIIALAFNDVESKVNLVLPFGISFNETKAKLNEIGVKMEKLKLNDGSEMIEDFINGKYDD